MFSNAMYEIADQRCVKCDRGSAMRFVRQWIIDVTGVQRCLCAIEDQQCDECGSSSVMLCVITVQRCYVCMYQLSDAIPVPVFLCYQLNDAMCAIAVQRANV